MNAESTTADRLLIVNDGVLGDVRPHVSTGDVKKGPLTGRFVLMVNGERVYISARTIEQAKVLVRERTLAQCGCCNITDVKELRIA